MLKKLTEEQLAGILENAIAEFGEKGLERTSVSDIAKLSGVSVGVLYKYYENKDDLFQACLKRSLAYLAEVTENAAEAARRGGEPLRGMVGALIRACQTSARTHPSYFQMYHAITVAPEKSAEYAEEIERLSAELYARYIRQAQEDGAVRADVSPELIAFFFDNMLMMLHFSYSCRYYKERMKLYGADADDAARDEAVADGLLRLFMRAVSPERT